MKGQDAGDRGRYRNLDVKAADTEYVYPSHLRLPELMEAFAAWLGTADLHPVDLAAEAHLRFVTIHPFRDGNGRVGRLLMNLLLLRHGYPIAILRVQQRAEYIAALELAQSTDDRGALDDLIRAAVKWSLRETLVTALSASAVAVTDDLRLAATAWIGEGE